MRETADLTRSGRRSSDSDDPVHPAERVLGPAALDVHQLLAQAHGDLAGAAVGDGELAAPGT